MFFLPGWLAPAPHRIPPAVHLLRSLTPPVGVCCLNVRRRRHQPAGSVSAAPLLRLGVLPACTVSAAVRRRQVQKVCQWRADIQFQG